MPRRVLLQHILAGALIVAFFLQSFFASLGKSPTYDEPTHIAAALSYVQNGVFNANVQHPPLMKELAGISMFLAGIRLPDTPDVRQMKYEVPGHQIDPDVGNDVVTLRGPKRTMFWARLPLIIVCSLLGIVIYVWGRQMLGGAAAIGALFLFAVDPNLIGHSELVTTDMGLAVFTTLFFFCLWNWQRRPGLTRLMWSGIAMGLMLCAKFSAVFMVPVALLLMLAAVLLPWQAEDPNRGSRLLRVGWNFAVMCAVAALIVMAIYVSPHGLSDFVYGLRSVYADKNPDFLAYMAGELQPRFITYFAVGWLLKEPLALIGFVVIGCAALLGDRKRPLLDKLFLFVPPAVFFLACTLWAANLGIRYLIPAFPFACLAGGAGLARLIQDRSKWMVALGAALCVWAGIEAAGIYPDNISYFNEAACLLRDPGRIGTDGGTKCGPWWLDDSNTDWGQGLEQLREWRNAHPDSRIMKMAYFGSFPPEPYGIIAQTPTRQDLEGQPSPGIYVISAKYIARLRNSWVRTAKPTAVVGHVFYIFDVR